MRFVVHQDEVLQVDLDLLDINLAEVLAYEICLWLIFALLHGFGIIQDLLESDFRFLVLELGQHEYLVLQTQGSNCQLLAHLVFYCEVDLAGGTSEEAVRALGLVDVGPSGLYE